MNRVMIAITELDPGGAERLVYDTATRLDRSRFEPIVCSLDAAQGKIAHMLREAGVPVIGLDGWRRNLWGCARRLARVIAEHKPQILHTHLFHANIAGRLAVRRIHRPPHPDPLPAGEGAPPVVLSHVHIVERRFRPWHFWLDRRTAKYCAAELCVSESVRQHQAARTGLPHDFFRIVPNGIDLTRFGPPLPEPKPPLVVGVGHLRTAQKGFDVLLAAWPHVLREIPAARLIIAGDGSERAKLERMRQSLPDGGMSVELPGHVDDVPALLVRATLFCMPSRWEGSPLACMEAMAAGLPVVASRIGPLEELVDNGTQGMLVPPNDPAALAAALVSLLKGSNRRIEMGQTARKRAHEQFNVDRTIQRLEELYAWALETRRSGT
jgi:glycosyltransferase involved in cell wall biosynthesis